MKPKVGVTLSDDILAYVDNFAKDTGISRSGAICVMIAEHRQSHKGLDVLGELVQMVKTGAPESVIAAKEKELP